MHAELEGEDFKIRAGSPKTQVVTYKQPTDWTWVVEPTDWGENKKLRLTVTAMIPVQGESAPREVGAFSKTVTVTVTPGQRVGRFFNKNGAWFIPLLLSPVLSIAVSALYNRWDRRSSQGESRSTETPPTNGRSA
jgi:hypothetical protein